MNRYGITAVILSMGVLQACTNSPEEQHQIGCVGATVTGALVGGVIGNQFGGGSGKAILTGAGAAAGGVAANSAAGC